VNYFDVSMMAYAIKFEYFIGTVPKMMMRYSKWCDHRILLLLSLVW
jgi:hypothetical protein